MASAGNQADGSEPVAPAAPPPPPPPAPEPAEPAVDDLSPPEPIDPPVGRFPAGVLRPDRPIRVQLVIDVAATGEVGGARIAKGAGEPFDSEAAALAKSLKFRPARRGGRAIALTVPWVVTFR